MVCLISSQQSLEMNEKQILECQRRIKQLTEELENKNHKLEVSSQFKVYISGHQG